MPANFNKPNMQDFGKYLESILGPEYAVSYIERKTPRGQVLPEASFFHISHTRGNETVSTNLNINLPAQSNFTTNYGNQNAAPVNEWAPQLMTRRGDYGYVFAGTLERSYQLGAQQGNRARTAKDPFTIQQVLRGPTASFAAALSTSFETVRTERAQGNTNADVQSHLYNIAAEGADENADISVAAGTMLINKRSAPSLVQNAAKTLQLSNVFADEKAAGVAQMEQARRMNEYTYHTIETNAPIYVQAPPGQPNYTSTFGSALREYGYAQDRGMSGGETRRLREYFHYAARGNLGYLPTSSMSKHLNLIEGRDTAEPLDFNRQPIAPTPIPQRGFGAGYRLTTAQVGGRIPEAGFVTTNLYTPQEALQPGGGTLYPENMGIKIGAMGFRKTPSYVVAENIEGLIQGDININVPHHAGEIVPSSNKWTYANVSMGRIVNQKGQLENLPEVPLEERMGAQNLILGQHQLVIPKYRNAYSGYGESYDPDRLAAGELREVTNKEIAALQARLGFGVTTNETVNKAYLEFPNSFVDVNAKWAGEGEKIGLTEEAGRPVINVGTKSPIPITTTSIEIKSLPEKMITSLGGLNATRQERLLSQYAEDLRLSELQKTGAEAQALAQQYEGVTTVLGETRTARAQNPAARLDIDRMSELMGLPAHEVGRDILQRIFLGGRTTQQLSQMSETELNTMAQSPQNLTNLRRYGTGFVGSDMTTQVSRMYEEQEYQTLLSPYQLANPNMGAAESEAAFQKQFGFAAQAENGQRMRTHGIPGFAVTGISSAGLEWSGGGRANAEIAGLLTAKAPDYAAALGLSTLDTEAAGNLSRGLEAQKIHEMRNPARWGAAQLTALSMVDRARGTSGFEIPESTTITEQMASKMSSDVGLMSSLGRSGSTLAGLTAFESKLQEYFPNVEPDTLKTRPLAFETAPGYYLPSTHAIRTQAEESVTGEDKTRLWNMAQGAIRQGIEGSTYHDPDAVMSGGNKIYNYLAKRFGLSEGVKTEGNKALFGSDVPITNARYSYWQGLKQNEVYVPEELARASIRHGLTGIGVEPTEEDVNQMWNAIQGKNSKIRMPSAVKQYVKEMGLPISGGRWPLLEGKGSAFFGNLVTSQQLERRGSAVPIASGMSNSVFRIGAGLSSILGGDFDLDQLWAAMGITSARRGKSGNLSVQFGAFTRKGELRPSVETGLREVAGVPYRKILEGLFPSGMSEQFDPLYQNILKTGSGGMAAIAKLMGTQYDKAGLYPYQMLKESLQTWSGSKTMMGSTYNYTRAREAQQSVSGWTTEQIMQARRTRAQLYQPFLDILAKNPTPLVEMYQKSFLSTGTSGGVGTLGMGWGLTNDKNDINWTSKAAQNNRLDKASIMQTTQNMLYSAIQPSNLLGKQFLPTPELLASDFSPEGSRAFVPASGRNPLDVNMWRDIQAARNAGTPNLEMERQYYEQTSLQEALTGPYQGKGTIVEKAQAMRDAGMDWFRANYAQDENRLKMFNMPILGAMFGKAVASKALNEPGWQPPDAFAQTEEGQLLMQNAALQQPLFNMMKGKLFPADTAMKFMRGAQNLGRGVNNTLAWGLGNIQNLLGFGKMGLTSELGTMYEQVADMPVEIRGHEVPALAGVGPKYETNTTLGKRPRQEYREQSLLASNVYSVGKFLGYQNPFKLSNMLFPSEGNKYLEAGTIMEARLGAIMGEKAGWKSVNPMRYNEDTGRLESVEASNPAFPWSSPFTWRGKLSGQQHETIVSATEDFVHNVRRPGQESFMQFEELKHVSAGITREQIIKERLPAAKLQSRVTPWTIEENLKDVARGGKEGEAAAERILQPLRSRFETEAEYKEAQENLLAGRFGSRPTFVQAGSPLATEIEKGANADVGAIQGMIEEQHQPGYWGAGITTSYVSNPTQHDELTQQIAAGSRDVLAARPRSLAKMWDIAAAAPAYWEQRQKQLQAAGQPLSHVRAMMDTAGAAYKALRSIGVGAYQDLTQTQATGPSVIQSGMGSAFAGMPFMPPMPGATGTTSGTTQAQTPLSQQATIPVQPPAATPPAATTVPTAIPTTPVLGGYTQKDAEELARLAGEQRQAPTLLGKARMEQLINKRLDNSNFVNQVGRYAPPTGSGAPTAGTPVAPGGTTGAPVAPSGGVPLAPKPGQVDPTAQANRFLQQYNQFFPQTSSGAPDLNRGVYAANQALFAKLGAVTGTSVTTVAEASAALANMSSEDITKKFGGFQKPGQQLHEMYRLAGQVIKNESQIAFDKLPAAQRSQVIDLARQVRDTSTQEGQAGVPLITASKAFEVTKTKDTAGAPMGSVLAAHFEKLSTISQKLYDNMEALRKGSIDYNTAKNEETRLVKEGSQISAQIKTEKVGGPLEEAGLLQRNATGQLERIAGIVPRGIKQAEDLAKFEAARNEELAGVLPGEAQPRGLAGFGGMARKALGGWGMMFAGRMFGLATGGMTYSGAEAAQLEGVFGGAAGQMSGTPYMPYNQAQRIQNLKALYGSEVQGLPGLQTFAQTTPGLSDVYNTAVAGLGGFGYAAWIGSLGGKDSMLSKYAPAIGGVLAAASLIGTGAQKAQNPEPVGQRMAYASRIGSTPGEAIGQIFSLTDTIAQILNPSGTKEATQGYQEVGFLMGRGATPASMVSQLGTMHGGKLTAEEANKANIRAMRLILQENPELSPEAVAKAYSFGASTGIAQDQYSKVAAYMQQTGMSPEVMSNIMTLTGRGYGAQYGGGQLGQAFLQSMGTMTPTMSKYLEAGQGVLQQMGTAATYATQGMDWTQLQNYTSTLGQYAGTPQAGVFTNQMQQWQQQKQFGWNVQQPNAAMLTHTPTQEELGIEAIRSQKAENVSQLVNQIGAIQSNYLGRTDTEAWTTQQGLSGKSVGELQKMLDEMSDLAKSVAMQRSLVPGKTEQYYQDYRAQMESMVPSERIIQQGSQDQLLAAREMLMQQGVPYSVAQPQMEYLQANRTPQQITRFAKETQWGAAAAEQMAMGWSLREPQKADVLSMLNWQAEVASGMPEARVTPMGTPYNDYYKNMIQGIAQFEPYALTQGVANGLNIPGTETQIPGFMASRDIWGPNAPMGMAGMPLNAPAFTVSGASHPLFGMLQQNLGSSMNWKGGVGQAFSQGYQVPGTNFAMAGLQGAQNYLMVQQAENQAAYAGNSAAQLALAMKYTPQMWGIQDQTTNLGYEQQRWGFQRQEQGLQMQQQQAQQNWGMQQTQMNMQRGWTRQDWVTQDQQRNQQWGWQVEDFQENVRFMTGRDRRLAERQMSRATITHDQEGDQIDKNRKRQEEMWALEDERFDLQKQQFMENQKFQEEGIAKQKEFFEQRVVLETQLRDLQREYQREQWELQKQMVGIQAKQAQDAADYATLQAGISATMLEQQTMTEDIQKNGVDFVTLWDTKLKEWVALLGGTPQSGGNPPSGNDPNVTCPIASDWTGPASQLNAHIQQVHMSATGSPIGAGEPQVVGEHGKPEWFVPNVNGKITPYKPWDSTSMKSTVASDRREREPALIIVNIGNEELKRYVVKAVEEEL
jgi:hypothetical protein